MTGFSVTQAPDARTASAAIPALIEALKDENELVRMATNEALRRITAGESGHREDDAGPPGPGESDPGRQSRRFPGP